MNSESRSTASQDFVYETVKGHLKERGMAMKQGTISDAPLIAAPSSTPTEAGGRACRSHQNKEGKRDLEMHQTKKGNQCY